MRNRSLTGLVMAGLAAVWFLGGFQPETARAANLPYSLSVSPSVGGYLFEGNQGYKYHNHLTFGLALGYNLDEHWSLEAAGFAVPNINKIGSPNKWHVYGAHADVLYHLFPDGRLVPYLAAGAGVLFTESASVGTDHDVMVTYGGGLKYFLTDRVALRLDVRHIFDITANSATSTTPRDYYNHVSYTAGVTFQLGGVRAATPAVEKPMPEVKAPAPEEVKPAPTPAPAAEPPPPAVPVPVKEEPTSWQGTKTAAIEGKIMVTGMKVDQNALEITASERIRDYKVFTLSQPSRLVIDISNAVNALGVARIPVHKLGIAAVRFGSYPDHLRLVFDAAQSELLPYRIEETDTGLKVIVAQ